MKPVDRFGRNGWSPVPHSFFTVLTSRMPTNWCMLVAVGYIMDRTFGVPEKPDWVRISLSQLARMTGKRAQSFAAALTEAVKLGIVERRGSAASYEYRVWPEEWDGLPRYVEDDSPIQPIAADDGAEAVPEPAPVPAPAGETQVIQSGKTAKPVVLEVRLAGVAEPVPLKFQARNESGYELAVHRSVKPDGTFFVTLLRGGEEKANGYQASLTESPKSLSLQHEKEAFFSYLTAVSLRAFGLAPKRPFLDRVVKLSSPATLPEFVRICEARLKRVGKGDTTGILLEIAKDAARAARAAEKLAGETRAKPNAWSGEGRLAADVVSDEELVAEADRMMRGAAGD